MPKRKREPSGVRPQKLSRCSERKTPSIKGTLGQRRRFVNLLQSSRASSFRGRLIHEAICRRARVRLQTAFKAPSPIGIAPFVALFFRALPNSKMTPRLVPQVRYCGPSAGASKAPICMRRGAGALRCYPRLATVPLHRKNPQASRPGGSVCAARSYDPTGSCTGSADAPCTARGRGRSPTRRRSSRGAGRSRGRPLGSGGDPCTATNPGRWTRCPR